MATEHVEQDKQLVCAHRTSVLSQRPVAAAVQTRRLVAAMCRSDLSHRVSRPLGIQCVFYVAKVLIVSG